MASATKTWKVTTLIVMLHVIALLGFVGEEWLARSVERERQANASFFSPEVAGAAEARAQEWFKAAFVDTGISSLVFGAMIPTQADADMVGMDRQFGSLFDWWEGRLRTWWTTLYQSFLRISVAGLWFPYALFVAVPFLIDGWVRRKVKQTDFSLASPLKHRLSLYAVEILVVAYVVLLFLPIPLQPFFFPLLVLISSAALGKMVAEFQKRA